MTDRFRQRSWRPFTSIILWAVAALLAASCSHAVPPVPGPNPAAIGGSVPANGDSGGAMRVSQLIEGLQPTEVPDTEEDVASFIGRLPPEMGGYTREASGGGVITYIGPRGVKGTITVASLSDAAGPNVSMSDYFTHFSESGQVAVRNRNAPASLLLYLVGTSSDANGRPAVAWSLSGGHWLYAAEADDWTSLEQMVAIFKSSLR